ncbi:MULTISPECIES: type II secretion system F family protein [unclassified Methylophaga]|jgi:type IV pilus assembly protein PilC|uniref:type II secretion system F family protein n=1 Tax=unclassified Methylophaga TaxID=2629249 RepID=UPI0025D61950|nr:MULTISPECIES: type II secretion system F family protein [unclassified Methylophaga]|tara:strand:+ start:29881 stop:31104 length:1224 start_codon:yes stop_codon:yes gene_type:complete
MPLYSYNALSSAGNEQKGSLQAANESMAAQELRAQGLRVLDIRERKGQGGFLGQANFADWLATQRSVGTDSLIFYFRQMAFMLRAGLPVAQALELSAGQISSSRLNLAIRVMLKDIEGGQSLSAAMKKHRDVFSHMVINLIVAGENTGELDVIMERLASHLEKRSALKKQMITALIYPVIVVLVAIGVAIFMVVSIIPKFATFLQGQGKALPASTQALIDISAGIRENGIQLVIAAIAILIAIWLFYRTPQGRLWMDQLLLRIPVMGKLMINGSMAQLNWAMSILLSSGVNIFDGLKITADLMPNRVYADKLKQAAERVFAGHDLSSSIRHPMLPALVTQMIAVGERTGTLDHILQELGTYYEKVLETGIKRLTALIEPAMILVIGGMVGFVYYAFFQALFALAGGR